MAEPLKKKTRRYKPPGAGTVPYKYHGKALPERDVGCHDTVPIINFDSAVPMRKKIQSTHPYMFQPPFGCIISGRTGCGKSNLLQIGRAPCRERVGKYV